VTSSNNVFEMNIHLSSWLYFATASVDTVGSITKKLDGDLSGALVLIVMFEQALVSSAPRPENWTSDISRYSVRSIADRLGLSKSTVSNKLNHLADLGYIEKYDRGFRITTTESGSARAAIDIPDVKHIIERMLRSIKADDAKPVKFSYIND
jgi:DNA-binding transcriptional ArsR family regulator